MNIFKTALLMVCLTLLLVWAGGMMGGKGGMIAAFVMAGVMNFVSYWFSDKIILAISGAREIHEQDMPAYYASVRRLAASASLPMPKVYVIDSPAPNAFATGRGPAHAAVAITRGISDILSEKELAAVIAHELSHIQNRDVLISTIAATVAGAVFMLARIAQFSAMFGGAGRERGGGGGNAIAMLAVAIIAPVAAMIIQMAISRSREYLADEAGARMAGDPLSLAGALRKISTGIKNNPVEVNPVMAHIFIASPFSGKSLMTLFSTHPSVESRVKRLESMATQELTRMAEKVSLKNPWIR